MSECFAPNPQTERGTATKINASSDGNKLVYANGNTVVIRDVKNPTSCQAYTEHKHEVTVAKFSPNGSYIASGDTGGQVRLWAYTHPDFLLKKETPVMAGKIFDLDFDSEGKRMVACGDGGKAFHAKAFMAETGSALGEISGPTKPCICVSYRPQKPFRIAVGSQDFKVAMFQGPPFKFLRTQGVHTNFVQAVKYSPDGSLLASCSSDKKVVLFDGESGDVKTELPVEHGGSIFGCAWHPTEEGKLMTVSGDKTVKLWDANAGKCVTTIKMDTGNVSGPDAMQVGCTYAGSLPVSLGLNGDISFVDFSAGSVSSVVEAHTTTPSRMHCDYSGPGSPLYLGTKSGQLASYDLEGKGKRAEGKPHEGYVSGMSASGGTCYSVAWDDMLKVIKSSGDGPAKIGSSVGLGSQPKDVSTCSKDNKLAVVCTSSEVQLVRDGKVTGKLSTGFEATSVALSPDGSQVAVGNSKKTVHIYNVTGDGSGLEDSGSKCEGLQAAPSCMEYSPNGKYLAVGDRMKEVTLWDASTYENKVRSKWVFHQSTINGISFSPDSQFVASGSIDTHVYIWNVDKAMKKTKLQFAHPGGVADVAWADEGVLFSCGEDGCIRKWKPDLPQ